MANPLKDVLTALYSNNNAVRRQAEDVYQKQVNENIVAVVGLLLQTLGASQEVKLVLFLFFTFSVQICKYN